MIFTAKNSKNYPINRFLLSGIILAEVNSDNRSPTVLCLFDKTLKWITRGSRGRRDDATGALKWITRGSRGRRDDGTGALKWITRGSRGRSCLLYTSEIVLHTSLNCRGLKAF